MKGLTTLICIAVVAVHSARGAVISNDLNCKNTDDNCDSRAKGGECHENPVYMIVSCAPACDVCFHGDKDWSCSYKARRGDCIKYPSLMSTQCPSSCSAQGQEGKRLAGCLNACSEFACASDTSLQKGCNQMFSCTHACKMRQLGVTVGSCRTKCERNGQSGCFPNVNGYTFNLCVDCSREGCPTYPTVDECKIGCDYF
ncbi:putative tyrosinase-like protein tyr-3 [Clytia hemisphaerica]|uniref:ShKT domain-containing protein n=1 Tax=Clytia hemisphaerica TaxID=252671 RepID=A0A7M5X112_9CNID|eukprot:TCONS_00008822-protein